MKSILIKNGWIIDGTGNGGFDGHVRIQGDKIEAVTKINGDLSAADETIDAAGHVVAPGFIDMHSHSDWALPLADHDICLSPLLEQGVTTVVGGNCGFSPAPFTDKTQKVMGMDHFNLMIDKPLDYQWTTMAEFLDRVEQARPVLNMAELAGHGTIRLACADTRRGAMPEHERSACLDALRESLDAGACGLSFGLGYDPGMYSPADEIDAFCRVAADAGKPVTVHLKALSRISPTYPVTYLKPHNVRALKEMLDAARRTGVRLQVSHLIFAGRRSWPTAETCLNMIADARKQGVDVMFDAFPYTCGNTTINVVLPYWFLAGLPEAAQDRWMRARLRTEMAVGFGLLGFSFSDFQLMDAAVNEWQELNGYRLPEIAAKWNTTPFDAMLRLSRETRGQAMVLFHKYSGEPGREQALDAVLADDACLFETDAIIHFRGHPNPATLGTFPKILGRYVRDRKLFSIENAVRRMTGASAERFGLRDRGVLVRGKKADVVIFDPAVVDESAPRDPAPAGKPKGIAKVFINGIQVVDNGDYISGIRAGEVIRV
jgi:N-acyl-D-amino-acid deacylase